MQQDHLLFHIFFFLVPERGFTIYVHCPNINLNLSIQTEPVRIIADAMVYYQFTLQTMDTQYCTAVYCTVLSVLQCTVLQCIVL